MKTIQRLLLMIYNRLSTLVNFAKCILAVLVLFCVGVAIHYLCVCLPRHIEVKEANTYYQNMGLDYLGLIVAIFAIIVTLLVTWQIFSTIRAKEELKETQQEIKDGFESRLQYLENQMEQLSNKQSRADGIEEAKEQIDKAIDLALPKDVLERVNLDIAKKGTKLYEWLWSIIDEVKTNGQILDDYAKALKKCRKRVSYINGREATEIEVIELANEIRPIKLMILGAIKK